MELLVFDPPKTWEEFVSLRDKLPCCTPETVRFETDLCYYRQYLQNAPRETRLQNIRELIGNNQVKIIQNNFPYLKLVQYLGNVVHYCLWSTVGRLDTDQIETEINKKFAGKKYLWFENIEAIKSIPEIWHCHVFVKED